MLRFEMEVLLHVGARALWPSNSEISWAAKRICCVYFYYFIDSDRFQTFVAIRNPDSSTLNLYKILPASEIVLGPNKQHAMVQIFSRKRVPIVPHLLLRCNVVLYILRKKAQIREQPEINLKLTQALVHLIYYLC